MTETTTTAAPVTDTQQTTTATAATVAATTATTDDKSTQTASTATTAVAGKWPDDWRQQYAGTDTKKLGVLSRYTSPSAALDALFAAQQRISAGELKKALPKDATPEQIAAYRTENGIPEKPEGYLEKLPQGLVIGDEDKPLFTKFAEKLHAKNLPPEAAHAAVEFYNELQEEQQAALVETDRATKASTEDKLRAEWGAEYRANLNHLNAFIDKAPEAVSEVLLSARTADGTAILNVPEVVQWFAQQARELDPIGTIVPNNGTATAATVDSEIAEIEKLMKTNRAEYNRDEKKQARLRELYSVREKLKARNAA